ncbi:V-type proton ATPase subunit C [Halotydeus destructor]|nr:V-type proton ATPase subunit C [Halotydeus destructor]
MSEFWLISAPGEKTCQQTWETLNNQTSKQNDLCRNYKFHIPDLKVGTLDTLVGLSDDLGKLDSYAETVCRKLSVAIADTLETKNLNVSEHLQANSLELGVYVTRFQWDLAKYPTKQSLKSLHDIINKQIAQIDADMKTKHSAYNSLKSNLQSMERKQTGSLLVRNLGDLVKKDHFVLGSEYLTTLLVVVPKAYFKDWLLRYEQLAPMVVPRSSVMVTEDNDHGLFSVTVFNKVVDEFKQNARENKFIVREFNYNEADIVAGKHELERLENDKKRQFQVLLRWLKVNFSESFIAWIHVKALRLFVESVLRYGLPVNFLAVMIQPNKKSVKRLRETLNSLYAHLDSTMSANDTFDDIPGLNLNTGDYYPYVYLKLNVDMLDTKTN